MTSKKKLITTGSECFVKKLITKSDNSQYQVGFPMPFISVRATGFGINPLMSMAFNPLGLLCNGIIVYLMIIFCIKVYQKIRASHTKLREVDE